MNRDNQYNTRRTALLDADILIYQCAAWAQARQVDIPDCIDRVRAELERWVNAACASDFIMCVSCGRDQNFRRDFWPKYKEHRDGHEDPPLRGPLIEWLKKESGLKVLTAPRIEADDLLGILGANAKPMPDGSIPVIVTIDKDLRQIPGWHCNPDKEDHPVWVSPDEAEYFFYQQWQSGDATDNIPGMYKVGPAKAQKLLDSTPRAGWAAAVLEAYAQHPQKYSRDYALSQARCVRILTADLWDAKAKLPRLWNPPEQAPTTTGGDVREKPAPAAPEASSALPDSPAPQEQAPEKAGGGRGRKSKGEVKGEPKKKKGKK